MDSFGYIIFPFIRHVEASLSARTTLCSILTALCMRATQLEVDILELSETLKEAPSHLRADSEAEIGIPQRLGDSERLDVGGETLEDCNLQTLQADQWLDDKVGITFPYLQI